MSFDIAVALGAILPASVSEHRAILRSGRFIRLRIRDMMGMAMFWELQPGL